MYHDDRVLRVMLVVDGAGTFWRSTAPALSPIGSNADPAIGS